MNATEKRTFARQMYTNDSEVGRMKLQSVKEDLYEATTKVVLYSIEMYTKKDLAEWVQTDLLTKLDKANNDLKREREELEEGRIGMFDITNGCSVINDFVRKDALTQARLDLQKKIELQKSKIAVLEEKDRILEDRKKILELSLEKSGIEDSAEGKDYFNTGEDSVDHTRMEEEPDGYGEDETHENTDDGLDDYDDEDDGVENDQKPPSETEIFAQRMAVVRDLEEISNISEEIAEEKAVVGNLLNELVSFTKSGKDILTTQSNDEKANLDNLRTLRNTVFAHRSEDEQEISLIGSWEPEAGPLYQWATEILKYIKVIAARYRVYARFDDFYASREGKDKFDGCKVYVQKQIKELYVNHSSVVFEFAGDLYDKEDEEYNFRKLIENMAVSWNTGIRYLTVVTNEDLPELNIFFKECLSGTNKYVDFYLLDRNALREACSRKNTKEADYSYFRLLYHLHPNMERIYWKGRSFSKREYARQVIYKYIKVKNMFQFDARLNDYEKYLDGIDVKEWCEQHLLSEVYFLSMDDPKGRCMAREMEDAINDFCRNPGKGRSLKFRRAIKASVLLYFYMGKDYVFSYTRSNGQTVHWRSLEDACRYMESGWRFQSYDELCGFVDELYQSDYFKIWRNYLKKAGVESEV